jgi:hypothetical protein
MSYEPSARRQRANSQRDIEGKKKLFGALVSYETSESGAGVEFICFRRIVITSPEPHLEF